MSLPESITVTYGNEDLDVYTISSQQKMPLIVYVHGGAWRSESKEEHKSLATRLRDLTACPVAVLDYRLTNTNNLKHPAHARDVLDALHFLIRWPDGAPFDHTRLFLIGHSAGAHMLTSIFLHAAASPYLPDDFLKPDDALLRSVRGIALASGIYDLQRLIHTFPQYEDDFLRSAFRYPLHFWTTSRYPLHSNAYPIYWLIVHSSGDTLVDIHQSEAIFQHLVHLYEDRGWDPQLITRDWSSLTGEHYYTNDLPFAQLIVQWLAPLL